jgi:hypothetical protein
MAEYWQGSCIQIQRSGVQAPSETTTILTVCVTCVQCTWCAVSVHAECMLLVCSICVGWSMY